jgi:hypothetical protein
LLLVDLNNMNVIGNIVKDLGDLLTYISKVQCTSPFLFLHVGPMNWSYGSIFLFAWKYCPSTMIYARKTQVLITSWLLYMCTHAWIFLLKRRKGVGVAWKKVKMVFILGSFEVTSSFGWMSEGGSMLNMLSTSQGWQ